VLLAK